MEVLNKVKNLKTADTKTFLSWEFNTLKDSKRDVTKLKNAIRKSGWSFPVIVWNNFVIDGAGRKKAVEEMIKEGDTIPEIPYVEIEAENLQDAKAKALEVSSQFGEITRDSFLSFTEDLELDFDTFEIDGMSADSFIESDEKDDEVPETPTDPKSKLGDLYELGEHRVLCGDSTKIEDVERLMNGKKADMVFTDPPYGVDYEGIKNDDREGLTDLLRSVFTNYLANSKSGASIYCFHSDRCADIFHILFREFFHFSSMIIWVKNSLTLSQTDYQSQHEPCLYGWMNNGAHSFYGDRKQTSIWKSDKERVVGHTTPKPIEIVTKAIANSSKGDDIVLDLFLGSGSTIIASEKTGRICYGMELDPKYVDTIVERWCKYTGITKIKKNGEDYEWELQKEVDSPKVIKNGIDETHLWKKKTK